MRNINAFFIKRHRLTLTLMWIFFAIALGLAVILNIFYPEMSFLSYFACLIVPALLAVYFRALSGRAKSYRLQQEGQGKTAPQTGRSRSAAESGAKRSAPVKTTSSTKASAKSAQKSRKKRKKKR